MLATQPSEEAVMKNIARNFVVLAVFAMALSGFASAQQFNYRVVAHIPYDFYVGDQPMSAGDYVFAVNYGDRAVTITNQANGHSSVVLASPIEFASPGYDNRDKGTVVELNSVGGNYVLSDLVTRTNGVKFQEANSNRAMAKSEGKVTIVAALR
jgi:hypothetical protein